jgi:hypothetical protein
MSARESLVDDNRGKSEERHIAGPSKRVSSRTPVTASEMSESQKRSRISEKKKLGQPAGKPKKVKPLKRK